MTLAVEGGQAVVAVAAPTPEGIARLCRELGLTVRPVLAAGSELREVRERLHQIDPDAVSPVFREFGQYLRDHYGWTSAEVVRFWQRTVLRQEPADIVLAGAGLLSGDQVAEALAPEAEAAPLLASEAGMGIANQALPSP